MKRLFNVRTLQMPMTMRYRKPERSRFLVVMEAAGVMREVLKVLRSEAYCEMEEIVLRTEQEYLGIVIMA